MTRVSLEENLSPRAVWKKWKKSQKKAEKKAQINEQKQPKKKEKTSSRQKETNAPRKTLHLLRNCFVHYGNNNKSEETIAIEIDGTTTTTKKRW